MYEVKVRRAFYKETVVQISDEEYERDWEGAASDAASLVHEQDWDEWGIERDNDHYSLLGQVEED